MFERDERDVGLYRDDGSNNAYLCRGEGEGERWFVSKIRRSDTKEVGEYEKIETSELHKQAERTKK